MLLLCSNGLTSPALLAYLSSFTGAGKAALVVTADHAYKASNYHVPRCMDELEALGLRVDVIDIDVQPVEDLLAYDVVEFIGGNPYYLLQALKRQHAKDILSRIASEKALIGWSAGALVMTPSIGIIDEFSPEMNLWDVQDLSGMALTDVQIVPHYSRFLHRYERFEARCRAYEETNECRLIRLSDGEGVVISMEKPSVYAII